MKIDSGVRRLYASYHTVGHLIANIVEGIYPFLKGTKGNHFPGKGAVIFTIVSGGGQGSQQGFESIDKQALKSTLQERVEELIRCDLPVLVHSDYEVRKVQIGNMESYACGGTHLKRLGDSVGSVFIKKVALKKKEGLKISYAILEA